MVRSMLTTGQTGRTVGGPGGPPSVEGGPIKKCKCNRLLAGGPGGPGRSSQGQQQGPKAPRES